MKKLLLITLLILGTIQAATLTGCTDPAVITPTIASKLVGKWTMQNATSVTIMNGVTTPQTTNFTASDYFEFKTGGTVTIVESGATHTGTWKVTNDRVFFTGTNYMDNTTGWAVPTLTSNKLQFYNKEVTSSSTTEFTLNLVK